MSMDDRELLTQLLKGETRLGSQTVAEILGRGETFRPALEQLIGNIRLWHTEHAGRIAVFHAVKLLGVMKFEEAIPRLIDAIFLAYSTNHEDVLDELPIVFSRIGAAAVDPLQSILDDTSLHPTVRSVTASALEGIGVLHPAVQDRILEVFREQLSRPEQAGQVRAHVVGLIAHFGRTEDGSLVTATLHTMPTALDITEGEVDSYFESSTEPWEWSQYRVDPLEFYDDELA